jgi:hypothetical protein
MHYCAIVAVPEGTCVDDILDPYSDDHFYDKEHHSVNEEHLQWDWWHEGGRWSGCFFVDDRDSGVKSELTDRIPYTFVDEHGIPWSMETYKDGFKENESFNEDWLAFLVRIPDDNQD